MARLHSSPYTYKGQGAGFSMASMDEQDAELRRMQAAADALPEGTLVGKIVDFSVADGRAMYLVKSESPLVLQHIPFFDAYRVSPAHIRGLRIDDIRTLVRGQSMMKSMFAKRAPVATA